MQREHKRTLSYELQVQFVIHCYRNIIFLLAFGTICNIYKRLTESYTQLAQKSIDYEELETYFWITVKREIAVGSLSANILCNHSKWSAFITRAAAQGGQIQKTWQKFKMLTDRI